MPDGLVAALSAKYIRSIHNHCTTPCPWLCQGQGVDLLLNSFIWPSDGAALTTQEPTTQARQVQWKRVPALFGGEPSYQ